MTETEKVTVEEYREAVQELTRLLKQLVELSEGLGEDEQIATYLLLLRAKEVTDKQIASLNQKRQAGN